MPPVLPEAVVLLRKIADHLVCRAGSDAAVMNDLHRVYQAFVPPFLRPQTWSASSPYIKNAGSNPTKFLPQLHASRKKQPLTMPRAESPFHPPYDSLATSLQSGKQARQPLYCDAENNQGVGRLQHDAGLSDPSAKSVCPPKMLSSGCDSANARNLSIAPSSTMVSGFNSSNHSPVASLSLPGYLPERNPSSVPLRIRRTCPYRSAIASAIHLWSNYQSPRYRACPGFAQIPTPARQG